ncbi:MAG: hypothetical protein LBF97_01145 [Elusimicrobiota bacterium]|jgi:hypothetical protein|nr:hypothetical protein [Elusimicrobiota bacterium]
MLRSEVNIERKNYKNKLKELKNKRIALRKYCDVEKEINLLDKEIMNIEDALIRLKQTSLKKIY